MATMECVPLSRREHDVLRLVGEGKSNAQIAETLGLGFTTIRSHMRMLYSKIDVEGSTKHSLRRSLTFYARSSA